MNVGICLDKHDFLYDIHSLVKSFFPEDEVSIFTDDDEAKKNAERNLLITVSIPDYAGRKETKDALKREIYDTLSVYTGTSLPWGTLSGIRPTKIPMKMLGEMTPDDQILSYLKTNYYVSDSKADLALRTAKKERELLSALPLGDKAYSLYINIPFCPSICLYCTFSSSPVNSWQKHIDEYIDGVCADMRKKRAELLNAGITQAPVTVYIGGGTPTALKAEQLDRILAETEEIWNTSAAFEFTVEAGRPDSFTPEKLSVLKRHGVSRISVNPQTMNDKTLRLIGRSHTTQDTLDAFKMARDAGFDNINMDMILGLPGEGKEEVQKTLDEIAELGPDSLTVHSLAVKRASGLRKTIREDRENDINADRGNFGGLVFENSAELMDLSAKTASSLGMEPYYLYRQKNMKGNLENTGFAIPGKECLYNIIIMEEVQTIYAFGAGGSTKFVYPDGRIERIVEPKDVKTWLDRRK